MTKQQAIHIGSVVAILLATSLVFFINITRTEALDGIENGSSTPAASASTTSGDMLGVSTATGIVCDRYMTAFIKPNGDNDTEQVYRLQAFLKTFEGAQLELTGVYDEASIAAVHTFQTKYATEVLAPWDTEQSTGFVYLTTRKKVNEIYCNHGITFPLTVEEEQVIEKAKFPAAAATAAPPAARIKKEESKKDVVQLDEEKNETPVIKTPSSAFGDFFRSLFDRIR